MKEKNELPMGSAEQSEIDAKLDRILSECGLAYPFSADLMMNLPTLLEELNSRLAFLPVVEQSRLKERAIKLLKEEVGLARPAEIVDRYLRVWNANTDSDGKEVFTDVVQWQEPVDGADLLDEIEQMFTRHVILAAGASTAIALFIVHTFAFAAATISPLLGISSPVKRCGKTRLVMLLASLVRRPQPTSNITAAAVYRLIETHQPTLLMDEADTYLPQNADLRGILNSGQTKAGAKVVRCIANGKDFDPRALSTWAPKVVAMIGRMPETLEDRSVMVFMRRKLPGEHVESLRQDTLDADMLPLRRKIARWVNDNIHLLRRDPAVPPELHDRAADNWRPLLAIADAAGGDWPERARRAAVQLVEAVEDNDSVPEILLLQDLRDLFAKSKDGRLSSQQIVDELIEMEDRPWPEWKNGLPMTKPQLATALRPFNIGPVKKRFGGEAVHGYEIDQFREVFSRYLPEQPEQAAQAAEPKPAGEEVRSDPEVEEQGASDPLNDDGNDDEDRAA